MKNIKFYSREDIPIEMHKTKIVQKIELIPIEERYKKLLEAGNNTFQLKNKDIYLDMLTDSGVNAMSDRMQAAMLEADDSYAGSNTFIKMQKKRCPVCYIKNKYQRTSRGGHLFKIRITLSNLCLNCI